jgi:hypothetical protein
VCAAPNSWADMAAPGGSRALTGRPFVVLHAACPLQILLHRARFDVRTLLESWNQEACTRRQCSSGSRGRPCVVAGTRRGDRG